ncbi:MAG: ATP-binding protein, partial [Chloroflexota bacterium]|nr:ATP-binding protein [Chloroflexota bacterium]
QIYVGVMAISFHCLAVVWEERTRTAAALRLAHSGLTARHRRIVEQAPLGILVVNAEGRVLDLNPAWNRLWGAPGGTASAEGSIDPSLAPLVARAFTGEVLELPERESGISRNGSVRRVRGFAYPVKADNDAVTEVVLIEQDITDEVRARRELENANNALRDREEALSHALDEMAAAQQHREQLLEAERFARGEAERASQLKDEFLATLSHELRTPLNAILGWAQILQTGAKDSPMAPAVETIFRNARTQAKLIEDLLDMSRIMAGKVGLTRTRARLDDIVSAAVDALQPVAERKGVALSTSWDDQAVWLPCDPQRLQQVVTNLLDNGIKFTPPGGRVDVRVTASGDEARIVVADTGQGIPASFLPAVFERFRQADGSTTRRHGGLGLGLSIARQIVEMHGGSIHVASDGPDQGALFTVSLPLEHSADAPPDEADAAQAVPLAGLRVLVVDDDRDARELLRRLLIEQDCVVSSAESADEALRELVNADVDVLLTDIGMPDVDGYELLRLIRAGRHAGIKAVAVTAFARPEDRDRALAAGFDDHLAKPLDAARLLRVLAAVRTDPPVLRTSSSGPPAAD